MKDFIDIFTMQPINRLASINTDQRACVEIETDLNRDEIIEQLGILRRKMRSLSDILGIKNKQNRTNLKIGIKKRMRNKSHLIPDECFEYLRTGVSIHILCNKLNQINNIRASYE